MYYTVSDFARTYDASLTLVAGGGGLARPVREVGILDYELMPGMKVSYQRVNFYDQMLVLSTFLYAKDNPYLILDAVKYLVGKGVSGLVVKNVLHLPIPDAAVRYANARNFPLFTVHGEFMFDQVVMQVARAVDRMGSAALVQRCIDALLHAQGEGERERLALELNPSLRGEVIALYSPFEDEVAADGFAAYESAFERSALFSAGSALYCYRDGLLAVCSRDSGEPIDPGRCISLFRADVLQDEETAPVGASSVRFGPADAAEAIREALRCARVAQLRGRPTVLHDDLGALRAILPHAASAQMQGYARAVLGPIHEFDAENNGQLLVTLRAFCDAGQNVAAAAAALGQHPNTIRYRLGKVGSVTGLSYREPSQMEQLSIACMVDFCARVLEGE